MSSAFDEAAPIHTADELRKWLRRDLARRAQKTTDDQLDALLSDAESAIRRTFERPRPLMPREVAKQVARFSRHISSASDAFQKGGDQLLNMLAIPANTSSEDIEARGMRLSLQLERLARLSTLAAETAVAHSRSMENTKRGRNKNVALESLIVHLMVCYQEILRVRLSWSMHDGLVRTGVAAFIKHALDVYGPQDSTFTAYTIDRIVHINLPLRDVDRDDADDLWL